VLFLALRVIKSVMEFDWCVGPTESPKLMGREDEGSWRKRTKLETRVARKDRQAERRSTIHESDMRFPRAIFAQVKRQTLWRSQPDTRFLLYFYSYFECFYFPFDRLVPTAHLRRNIHKIMPSHLHRQLS
jgi:hypothetical protein